MDMDSPERKDNNKYYINNIMGSNGAEIRKKLDSDRRAAPKSFEEIIKVLGGFGWFQVLVIILYLTLEAVTAFAIFIPIFVARTPIDWLCDNRTMNSKEICGCNGTIKATTDNSIVAEWNLICDQRWITDFITSIQMLGLIFGSIIGSQIADWYGRKIGFLLSVLLLALGTASSAVAPNAYVYAVCRFICGAGIQSFINVTGAGVMEFMPPKFRSLANCIGPLGEGLMILAVIAKYVTPWRTLYWVTTAPYALIFIIYPFLPESPRWLLQQNKIEETHKVLTFVARCNGKTPLDISVLHAIAKKTNHVPSPDSKEKQPGYLTFVTDPKHRTTSLFVMAIWFSWSLTYYGISFNIRNIEGDIYFNVFLSGLANALGQRVTLLTNDSLGRRMSLFSSMTFGAIFMVVVAVCFYTMEHLGDIVLIMCLLSLFGMSATRSTSKLLTGESFPTNLRAMSFGLSGISITLGGILAPLMASLGTDYPAVPFIILAVVSCGGSLISFLIKETKGQNLDRKKSVAPGSMVIDVGDIVEEEQTNENKQTT